MQNLANNRRRSSSNYSHNLDFIEIQDIKGYRNLLGLDEFHIFMDASLVSPNSINDLNRSLWDIRFVALFNNNEIPLPRPPFLVAE